MILLVVSSFILRVFSVMLRILPVVVPVRSSVLPYSSGVKEEGVSASCCHFLGVKLIIARDCIVYCKHVCLPIDKCSRSFKLLLRMVAEGCKLRVLTHRDRLSCCLVIWTVFVYRHDNPPCHGFVCARDKTGFICFYWNRGWLIFPFGVCVITLSKY